MPADAAPWIVQPLPPPAPALAPFHPLPPLPPIPSVAPVPFLDFHVSAPEFHYEFDMPLPAHHLGLDVQPVITGVLAQADAAAVRAQRDAERASAEVARQAQDIARQAREQAEMQLGRGGLYNSGLSLVQGRQYDRAITAFDRAIAQKDARSDGALYWKAFAQFKLGRSDDALATIAELRRDHPQSRYLNDAKVLETDVRRMAGQPVNPATLDDDEIKLLAIQGLQRSEQAIPLLEGVLNATNTLAVKKRALYVLALSDDPRARQILLRYAKGGGNPDLQIEAIRYLISRRDAPSTSQDLREIYESTQDSGVRLAIIDAYRSAPDKPALIAIASNKGAGVTLRSRAVSHLSGLATPAELWTLYQAEPEAALRTQMVSVFASMRALDQLAQIARTDRETNVRLQAIRHLGSMKGDEGVKARQVLVDVYGTEADMAVRRTIVGALANPDSAEALVALARKETQLPLKTEIVRRLSDLAPRSKVAADYLMEVIK
jgi:tetratricopeptide (TPR) repeat protein